MTLAYWHTYKARRLDNAQRTAGVVQNFYTGDLGARVQRNRSGQRKQGRNNASAP
jgi:hypothetical protein